MHWKLSSKARIASDFSTLLRIKQGEKRTQCHPKSDFRLWQATYFSTKNPIKKLAMNNRRLLIAAEFHFVHSVEKDSQKHDELTQNSISFSRQSKQVSRCCINFPHELTCYSGDYIGVSLTNSRESRVAGAKSRSRVQCRGRGSNVAVAGPMSRSRVQSRGRGSNVAAGENDLEFEVTEWKRVIWKKYKRQKIVFMHDTLR